MDLKKIIIFVVLAVVGAGGGVLLPSFLGLTASSSTQPDPVDVPAGPNDDPTKRPEGDPNEVTFIVFDRMVMNLNDPALIKYLTVEIVLRVDAQDEANVRGLIDKKKPMLKDRLTTLVADKALEDVMGKVGINRLKREVLDEFNKILFPDGIYLIHEALFDEWHVD